MSVRPHLRGGGGYPVQGQDGGGTPFAGLDGGGGYVLHMTGDGGTPPVRSGWGTPCPRLDGVPPPCRTGWGTPSRSGCCTPHH